MINDNIALIRDCWRMEQTEFGKLIGCTSHQVGGYERASAKLVPPEVIFELELITGIAGIRLYYEHLKRDMIPLEPLKVTDIKELQTPLTNSNVQYEMIVHEGENLTILERLKRLERELFGV